MVHPESRQCANVVKVVKAVNTLVVECICEAFLIREAGVINLDYAIEAIMMRLTDMKLPCFKNRSLLVFFRLPLHIGPSTNAPSTEHRTCPA